MAAKFDFLQLSALADIDPLTEGDFLALAGFRLALRQFLSFSEATVKSAGITTQQYQAILAIRARAGQQVAVKDLAREMMLKPNGAVQLIDRLELSGLVKRQMAANDRRSVLVSLTALGEKVIATLAAEHMSELVRQRPLLVESLKRLKSMSAEH